MSGTLSGGMCAAATQDDVVNHTVLLLCSEIQNIGKTTFINNLLPPELRAYLSTGLINPSNKDDLAKIAQAMLINLDEFEGMSGRELNIFKDLVTRKVISIRLPYARRSQNFPHTASLPAHAITRKCFTTPQVTAVFSAFMSTRWSLSK